MRALFPSVLLTTAAAFAQPAAHPAFWRYVHPDARFVLGADVTRVTGAAPWKQLAAQMEQSGIRWQQVAASKGFDFVSGIQQVFISSPGSGTGERGRASSPPVVMALQGKFNLVALRKELARKGAKRTLYRGVELLVPDRRNTDLVAALVSPQILLLGDGVSVRQAIDQQGRSDTEWQDHTLLERATELASMYEIWFVSEAPLSALDQASLPPLARLGDVEGFEGGISLASGLSVELALNTKSAQSAKELSSLLQALMQMASASPNGSSKEVQDLLRRLQLQAKGAQVTAVLRYSEEELTVSLGALRARLAPGVPAAKPATAAAEPEAGTPDRPLVVRIVNADGGPQEHSLPKQ
jgi:hypothetical protein